MTAPPWTWQRGDGALLATAIHAGHDLRAEAAALTAVDGAARLREEDPFTDAWTDVAATRVVVRRSRWEIDLNRSRDDAVYRHAEDCWGVEPWRAPPSAGFLERSRQLYDAFYAELAAECTRLAEQHGRFVVLDLHSYNHRRLGPAAPPAAAAGNPEVNVGTRSLDRSRWAHVVARFTSAVVAHGFDVRENVRFGGATLAAWVHGSFPTAGCCLAVDVKKIFMDEHTGDLDTAVFSRLHEALRAGAAAVLEEVA